MSAALTDAGPLRDASEHDHAPSGEDVTVSEDASLTPSGGRRNGIASERRVSAGPAVPWRGLGRFRAFLAAPAMAALPDDYSEILDTAHAPTVKVMQELRQARQRLNRVASPELGLLPAIRALLRTEQRLGRPLRVAICGEINAGKSSLANLLAGIESLPTAITLNTLIPTLLYYAAEPEIWAVRHGGQRERLRNNGNLPRDTTLRIEVGLPSPRLAAVQVLDLPGFTGSRWGGPMVELTSHHVDATIWCTVSTQAWKESERSAWSMLCPRLAARSLLVATHSDLLRRPEDRQSLITRLHQEVGTSFLGILPLATLQAIAVMGEDRRIGTAWVTSGAKALEAALAALLISVREQRAAAAQTVTGRIAHRALTRIESMFGA